MASITIQSNGTVVFSQAVLDKFPEITATVSGNTVTVSNVYLEELVSLVGNSIFWSDTQPFSSFSIEFKNNHADVDVLSNLMVRYINYHNGDYTVSLPKYSADLSILKDPLNLGVKPNYYKALLDYANGTKSIDALANDIKEIYLVAKPTASINIADIITIISTIPKADILKFLNSNTSIMSVYNATQDAKSKTFVSTGTQKYSLSTASKEFEMIEDANGNQTINKLCASDGEDVTQLIQKKIKGKNEVSLCTLKSMTCSDLANSNISKITTDVGIWAEFNVSRTQSSGIIDWRSFRNAIVIYTPISSPLSIYVVDLMYEICLRIKGLKYDYIVLSADTGEPLLSLDIGRTYGYINTLYCGTNQHFSIRILAKVRDLLIQKSISANNNLCIEMMSIDSIDGISEFGSIGLWKDATICNTYAETVDTTVKILNVNNLTDISFNGGAFSGSVFKPDTTEAIYIVSKTSLFSRIIAVDIGFLTYRVKKDVMNMIAIAIENRYRTITLNNASSGTIKMIGVGYKGLGVSFLGANVKDYVNHFISLVDMGVTRFDSLPPEIVLELSKTHIGISVDVIPNDMLLLCNFYTIAGAKGFYEYGLPFSNIDTLVHPYYTSLSEIYVNGFSLTNKTEVLKIICSQQQIIVHSLYPVRDKDIMLIQDILYNMRNGYTKYFRIGSTTAPIKKHEDAHSFEMLGVVYDAIIGVETDAQGSIVYHSGAYENIVAIAKGNSVSISHNVTTPFLYGSITQPVISIAFGRTTITKNKTSISVPIGNLKLTQQGSFVATFGTADVISFTNADVPYFLNSPYGQKSTGINFLSHNINGDILDIWTGIISLGKLSASCTRIDLRTSHIDMHHSVLNVAISQAPLQLPTLNAIQYTQGSTPQNNMFVKYDFTKNADGSVDVTYKVLDANNNDITSQFNTLTLDGMFSHKGV